MYDINLYPPIFNQSIMPAFVITVSAKVYFSISPLNNPDENNGDINWDAVQLTIRDQETNEDMLKSIYRNGIKIVAMNEDSTREGNDRYYVEITNFYKSK